MFKLLSWSCRQVRASKWAVALSQANFKMPSVQSRRIWPGNISWKRGCL